MTPEQHRIAKINAILAAPHTVILCEGCGSFVNRRPPVQHQIYVCPVCNGYAFITDDALIREQARRLALSHPSSIQKHELE